MNDERGFSTIELILAVVIAGIIMSAVGTFLTFIMQSFNTTKEIIDVQYEAQMAVNQFTDIAREASDIDSVFSGGSDEINNTVELDIESITFRHQHDGAADEVFVISHVNNELQVTIDANAPYVMANKVESFSLAPTNGDNFDGTNGLILKLVIKDIEASHDIQTQIKLRNKE